MPLPTDDPCKALVLDNDPIRMSAVADVLKNCGFTVESAMDTKSANHWLSAEQFDAVLCHETINGGSGLDVLKMIVKEHPDISFVLMADSPQSPSLLEAQKLGADIFSTPGDYATLFPKLAAIQSKAGSRSRSQRMTAHPVQLPELQAGSSRVERANVDMIMDVPVTINAVLGNTSVLISDLLQLGPGSVVELNKRAGEPVDLFVNDKLIAVGEVVVVNETFGIRITEVIDAKQRLQALA